jgi:hypothetical protein
VTAIVSPALKLIIGRHRRPWATPVSDHADPTLGLKRCVVP